MSTQSFSLQETIDNMKSRVDVIEKECARRVYPDIQNKVLTEVMTFCEIHKNYTPELISQLQQSISQIDLSFDGILENVVDLKSLETVIFDRIKRNILVWLSDTIKIIEERPSVQDTIKELNQELNNLNI